MRSRPEIFQLSPLFRRISLALLATALCTATCSVACTAVPGFGPGDFTAAYIEAYCAALTGCPQHDIWFATPTLCPSMKLDDNSPFSRSDLARLKAGSMVFDAGKAAECLAHLRSDICWIDKPIPQACYEVATGALANGDGCDSHADFTCQSGWCRDSELRGAQPGACGVCTARIPVGGTCDTSDRCAFGTDCIGMRCVAVGSVGVGGACDGSQRTCVAHAFCDGHSAGGVCRTRVASGGACEAPHDCVDGLTCLYQSKKSNEAVCGLPRKNGEVCFIADYEDDPAEDCGPDSVCGVTEPWDGNPWATATCVSQKKSGETCQSHAECGIYDGMCQAGKCSVLPGVGELCAKLGGRTRCAANTACGKDGKCAGPGGFGADCTGGGKCGEGLLCTQVAENASCIHPAKMGQPCGGGCAVGLKCDAAAFVCLTAVACK